jgi:hypothetical protein
MSLARSVLQGIAPSNDKPKWNFEGRCQPCREGTDNSWWYQLNEHDTGEMDGQDSTADTATLYTMDDQGFEHWKGLDFRYASRSAPNLIQLVQEPF